jgi:hypothetical protein
MRLKFSLLDLIVTLITACLVGVVLGLMASSKIDFDLTHRFPPVRSVSEAINLTGLAGEYYLGDGLGTNLRLSILTDGRYSLVSSGCTGVHHRESGFVRESNSQYVLSSTAPSEPTIRRNFVLVGWGQRHYLIPPDELQQFRAAIIEGREPRDDPHGRFYVTLPIAPAEGLPDSPPEWARDLFKDVLLGRVIEVGAVGPAKIGRVKVNLGAKDGVRAGDILVVQRQGHAQGRRFSVISVTNHSCLADESFPDASEYPLKPGLAVVAAKLQQRNGEH